MELKDKTITVTGGASGIGKAMAIRFAEEGARVIVADLAEEKAQQTAEQIQGLAVACDVTKEADIQNLVRQTEHEIGPSTCFAQTPGSVSASPTWLPRPAMLSGRPAGRFMSWPMSMPRGRRCRA